MKRIILDGRKMTSRQNTHAYLKRKLRFPAYYGGNLDALWDMLSTAGEPLHVLLKYGGEMQNSLGEYATQLLNVFIEAARENNNITFEILD